jgi:ribosomal protein S18 acetylase RimI-like enzyme
MKIRRITANEASLWQSAVEALLDQQDGPHRLIALKHATNFLADPRCYGVVAEDDSGLVGLLSAYRLASATSAGEIGYLYDIKVHEHSRDRGIGRALIEELLHHCKVDGVTTVWAGTDATNRPARRVFECTGASIAGNCYVEYEWKLD